MMFGVFGGKTTELVGRVGKPGVHLESYRGQPNFEVENTILAAVSPSLKAFIDL